MARKTHSTFLEEMKIAKPHISVLSTYTSSKVKMKFMCNTCKYIWMTIPYTLKVAKGTGCPSCAGNARTGIDGFKKAIAGRGITVLGKYINARTKTLFKCDTCLNEWLAVPDSVKRGSGCNRCSSNMITHEEFVSKLKERKITVVNKYTGKNKPISLLCDTCSNTWNLTTASSVWEGSGCKKCARTANRKTNATFLKEIEGRDITPLSEYKLGKNKMKFKCKKIDCNHIWTSTPFSIIRGSGCPECNGGVAYTHDEFIEKLGYTPFRVLGRYVNNNTKIDVECKTCNHKWSPVANSMKKNGCPKCAGVGMKTHPEFIDRIKNKNMTALSIYRGGHHDIDMMCNSCMHTWTTHASKLMYDGGTCPKCSKTGLKTHEDFIEEVKHKQITFLSKYIKAKEPIHAKCDICSAEWFPTPDSIRGTRNRGCPDCARFGFNPNSESELYLYNINDTYLGFGITGDGERRHREHVTNFKKSNADFIKINTFTFKKGQDAYDIELLIKKEFVTMDSGIKGFKRESTSINNLDAVLLLIEREMA